jgi:hypothetical protein
VSPAEGQQGQQEQSGQPDGQSGQKVDLLGAVGQVLMDVKKQLPTLEGLKQEKPEAYQSILAMTQALIALAQKISSGVRPEAEMQKSEDSEDFRLGIEQESKEHTSLSPEAIKRLVLDHLKEDPKYYTRELASKEELQPEDEMPPEDELSKKVRLPEQKPPPAHHHLHLPVGSVKDQKVKVVSPDGAEKWHSVRAGQVLDKDGNAASSRVVPKG